MILRVRPMRFTFRAGDTVSFPPGKAANIFRGAFGEIFRRIACEPDCPGAASCPHAAHCPYARMFEPRGHAHSPSGFKDQPRPFVLRAASLDGKRFETGEQFTLDVNVFDPEAPALDYFRQSFEQLWKEGLGPGRARVELLDAIELPVVDCDLHAHASAVAKIRVTFLTPTELKSGGEVLREPAFDALYSRARDRASGLITFYQASLNQHNHPPDFRSIGERARAVRMTAASVADANFERKSTRTGQRHSLGGFTGEAEYEGDLAEFLPCLLAAWWTGVGRLTVWGNGLVKTEVL